MGLKEDQEEFDKELFKWAEKHRDKRMEFWRERPIMVKTCWDALDKETQDTYLTPIPDGTFNAEKYGSKGLKIAWIAKEPPFYDQGNYRTNTNYSKGSYWTWLQRIAAGMLDHEYELDKIAPPQSDNEYEAMLCTSAWVNLQKFPCENTTDNATLKKWYREFGCRELLYGLLEILDPNILVFVGTGGGLIWTGADDDPEWVDLVEEWFFKSVNGEERKNKSNDSRIGIYYNKDKLLLDCYHIAAWGYVSFEEWSRLILDACKQWQDFRR